MLNGRLNNLTIVLWNVCVCVSSYVPFACACPEEGA